jgi:hypothetical protein
MQQRQRVRTALAPQVEDLSCCQLQRHEQGHKGPLLFDVARVGTQLRLTGRLEAQAT